MGKSVSNTVLDQALNYIKNNGSRLCFCSAEPTTYTEAITTYKLADVDITSGDYTGPADGDTSGRKLTVNAQTGITVDSDGTPTHLAIVDVTGTELLYVTTNTGPDFTTGSTVDMTAAVDIEIEDPA